MNEPDIESPQKQAGQSPKGAKLRHRDDRELPPPAKPTALYGELDEFPQENDALQQNVPKREFLRKGTENLAYGAARQDGKKTMPPPEPKQPRVKSKRHNEDLEALASRQSKVPLPDKPGELLALKKFGFRGLFAPGKAKETKHEEEAKMPLPKASKEIRTGPLKNVGPLKNAPPRAEEEEKQELHLLAKPSKKAPVEEEEKKHRSSFFVPDYDETDRPRFQPLYHNPYSGRDSFTHAENANEHVGSDEKKAPLSPAKEGWLRLLMQDAEPETPLSNISEAKNDAEVIDMLWKELQALNDQKQSFKRTIDSLLRQQE